MKGAKQRLDSSFYRMVLAFKWHDPWLYTSELRDRIYFSVERRVASAEDERP